MSKHSREPGRVLRTRQEAQRSYDRLSRWYDWLASSEAPVKQQALQMLDVQADDVILEIGFGTGQLLAELVGQIGPDGQIVGIDISPGMTAVARERLLGTRQESKVFVHLGDASSLPYPPGIFTAVLMTFTLELFDTPVIPKVLAECRRVLRSEGRLCAASLAMKDDPNLMTRVYEWVQQKIPAWVDCRPIPLRRLLTESGFIAYDARTGALWGLPFEVVCAKAGNMHEPI